jgi:hypothetical protein
MQHPHFFGYGDPITGVDNGNKRKRECQDGYKNVVGIAVNINKEIPQDGFQKHQDLQDKNDRNERQNTNDKILQTRFNKTKHV